MNVNKINCKGITLLFAIWLAVVYAACMAFGVLIEQAWAPFWSLVFPSYLGLPGFDTTAVGLLAGLVWALLYGAFGGLLLALLYNVVVVRLAPIELE